MRGLRTDGGRLDHVADRESLDCLVLRGAARAVRASDRLDVPTTLLVASARGESAFEGTSSHYPSSLTWRLASSPYWRLLVRR